MSKGDDKMKLYERIQMLRKKAGWSQEKLAEKLGVSRQTISKWENGAANPGMDRLQDLADALDITMAELLGTDAQATEDERIAEYEEEIRGLKKKRALHIVSILCICTAAVLLTVLFVTLFNRIRDMEYSVQMLEGQVGSIYDNMDSRISEIAEQLKEQNSLVADCRIEPSVESVRGGMLELSARVTPAVWKEGMEAELILEGKETYTALGVFDKGSFRAEFSVSLEEAFLDFSVHFTQGKETQTQMLDGVNVNEWVMSVNQENDLSFTKVQGEYKIQGTAVTVHTPAYRETEAERPIALNYPVSGEVSVYVDGEEVLKASISDLNPYQEPEEEVAMYGTSMNYTNLEGVLKDCHDGSEVVVVNRLTDNYGNIREVKTSYPDIEKQLQGDKGQSYRAG